MTCEYLTESRQWSTVSCTKKDVRESRLMKALNSLIISITYANPEGETGLDAILSNYFTLAKWPLLVEAHEQPS